MLLLLFSPQPAAAQLGFVNLSLSISDLWPPLNAYSEADAVHWTEAELYQYIDEGAKRIASKCGCFVVRDISLATTALDPTYDLPAVHLATIQADLNGRTLRPRNVQELEALDHDWVNTTSSEPRAFIQDTAGVNELRLFPTPTIGPETIGLVIQQTPPTISAAAAILAAPPIIRDYFTFYALAEARNRESIASMEEIVEWLRGAVTGAYEQAASALWGYR